MASSTQSRSPDLAGPGQRVGELAGAAARLAQATHASLLASSSA